MTYPPTGPHPYGQQAYYGAPVQPGQYGQQPPQFGPGGYPGLPGGPPRKKNTGLIVGLAIAAVLVVGGVTGLVLFLANSDDESPAAAGATTSRQAPPSSGTKSSSASSPASSSPSGGGDLAAVSQLGNQLAEAYQQGSSTGMKAVACDPSQIGSKINAHPGFAMAGDPTINGDTAEVRFTDTTNGETEEASYGALKQNGRWCMDISTS